MKNKSTKQISIAVKIKTHHHRPQIRHKEVLWRRTLFIRQHNAGGAGIYWFCSIVRRIPLLNYCSYSGVTHGRLGCPIVLIALIFPVEFLRLTTDPINEIIDRLYQET